MVTGGKVDVTILIPVYNEEKWIAQTLESLFLQTYSDFKVIIADNCSSDGSWEICQGRTAGDARFVMFRHDVNIGSVANFKFLLEQCETDFFMVLGAHDLIAPSFLEVHVGFLKDNTEYSLSYGNVIQIDEQTETIGCFNLPEYHSGFSTKYPLERYVSIVSRIPKGVLVNHVFRRTAVNPQLIEAVTGCDHVLIASTGTTWLWKKHEKDLYIRRYFLKRNENYIQRVAGSHSLTERSDVDMVKLIVQVLWGFPKRSWFIKSIYSMYVITMVSWNLFKVRKFRNWSHVMISIVLMILSWNPGAYKFLKRHFKPSGN